MRFADLDAVTVDGNGTLLALVDPVPALVRSLAARGIDRAPDLVRAAFVHEVGYYRSETLRGRDEGTLATLRRDCTDVFLRAAEADLDASSFVDDFMASIEFELAPGAVTALSLLRAHGLDLAVVSNWDVGLAHHLGRLGVAHLFSAVVTSAGVGTGKPHPAVFEAALEALGVDPARTLHVGDEAEDEQGAAAAGLRFARAPLDTAFEGWS